MLWGGARGQNVGHLCKILYCCVKVFICLYVSSQLSTSIYIWIMGAIVSIGIGPGFMSWGGARGQNLGHLCKILYCCVKVFHMLIC